MNAIALDPETFTCTRCGSFVSSPFDLKQVEDKPYCATCAARPEVDFLGAFKDKYWGKRDTIAWLVGFGVPFTVIRIAASAAAAQWFVVPGQLVSLLCGAAFFLGKPWSRKAMYAAFALNFVGSLTVTSNQVAVLAASSLIASLVWFAFTQSTMNKLFFKIDVSRTALEKAWNVFANNIVARYGMALGVLSLLVWPLSVIALPLSIIGLQRVNPQAQPPIGRKGQAIVGLVTSSLGLLATVGSLALMMLSRK